MAGKIGNYRVAYTYVQQNDAGTTIYETGRSPIRLIESVTGTVKVSGSYSTNTRITHIRIYSTLASGTVYYLEETIANVTAGGTWVQQLSMADTTLDDKATAYWTRKGYEVKRLYSSGVFPPHAFCVQAAGRLWAAGRMHRTGVNEDATLSWSELAPNYCDFPISNANTVFAEPIMGIYEQNEMVYVLTRTARWKVTPEFYNEGIEFDKLEGGVGCIGGHTVQKIGSSVIWLSQDGWVIASGDGQPQLISQDIRDYVQEIDKERARFAVSVYDRELMEYRCWLSLAGSEINDTCVAFDLSSGLPGKWCVHGGHGRAVYYATDLIDGDGKYRTLCGDHLGAVWQENISESDGANEGGTYQGLLSLGTTTSSTTTTTTTSTSTTTTTSTSTTTTTTTTTSTSTTTV